MSWTDLGWTDLAWTDAVTHWVWLAALLFWLLLVVSIWRKQTLTVSTKVQLALLQGFICLFMAMFILPPNFSVAVKSLRQSDDKQKSIWREWFADDLQLLALGQLDQPDDAELSRLKQWSQVLNADPARHSVQLEQPAPSFENWQGATINSVFTNEQLIGAAGELFIAQWPRQLTQGLPFTVTFSQAHDQLVADSPVQSPQRTAGVLRLLDPFDNEVARQNISPSLQAFAVAAPLPGNWLFSLQWLDEQGNVTRRESLPVSVTPPSPIRMTLMFESPSFENRYLQRWLQDTGVLLDVRYPIGKALTLTQQSQNTLAGSTQATTSKRSDLLLFEAGRYRSFTPQIETQLNEQLRQGGALVVLLRDEIDTALVQWLQQKGVVITKRANPAKVPVNDGKQQAVSYFSLASNTSGTDDNDDWQTDADSTGKLKVIALSDTYSWVTAGEAEGHAKFWQSLLQPLLNRAEPQSLLVRQRFPVVGRRMDLCQQSIDDNASQSAEWRIENPQGVSLEGLKSQLATYPSAACVSFWPQQSGWYRLVIERTNDEDLTQSFYVHSHTDWLKQRQWRNAVSAWLTADETFLTNTAPTVHWQFPRLWSLLLLVLTMALSWWQEKRL